MTHTDIKQEGWIYKCPNAWHPYLLLMRLDRPVGWWLLLLPGLWGIMLGVDGIKNMTPSEWLLVFYFFIGAILMRGAGCIVNDLWDRDLDKQVERTRNRPIASGQISVKNAVIFLGLLCALSLAILLQMTWITIILGIGSVFLIVAYPLMKRITYWPQLFLGITFNMGALMGFAAVTGTIMLPAICLYVAGILWTMGYDTIYALQDKDDDAMAGIKSTALLFGKKTKLFISIFYALCMTLILTALYISSAPFTAYAFITLPALHLLWQVTTLKPDNQSNALKKFQSNKATGVLILLSLAFV